MNSLPPDPKHRPAPVNPQDTRDPAKPATTPNPSSPDQNSVLPDLTPRREGGDDALAEAHPDDPRLDEKVIVNEQAESRAVNAPSQTSAGLNGSEESPL